MKKIFFLLVCLTAVLLSVSATAETAVETYNVSEIANVAENTVVKVEGYFVGAGDDGNKEMLIKDLNNDTIIGVYGVTYGEYPNFDYSYGDKISLLATVKLSTSSYTPNRKYLSFSSSNSASVNDTILSTGNIVTFTFENAVTVSTQSELNSAVTGGADFYEIIKFEGTTYFTGYNNARYRIHKTPDAKDVNYIRTNGASQVANFTLSANDANLGDGWETDLLGISYTENKWPGPTTNKSFYAVYVGANQYYNRLVILDPSWVIDETEPEPEPEFTNQDILKELAYAYFRQGGQIEYDQATATARRHISATPEDATSQKKIYLDCSSFVNSCYREGFGVNVLPYTTAEMRPSTGNFNAYARDNQTNADVIGYWVNADYTTDAEKQAVINHVRSSLQVGDVLSYRHVRSGGSTAGHVYIYVGNGTFLHCFAGGSYVVNSTDPSKSYDSSNTEATNGQIATISADTIFSNTSHARYIFKETTADTVTNFCIIRPLERGLTPTEQAVARMAVAGLNSEKTSSVGANSAVCTGDNITYTVKMNNTSSSKMTEVTLTDVIPTGTEYVSGSEGITVSEGKLYWSGDIDAGSTVTLTYTVTVTANAGSVITSKDTYAGGLKLSTVINTVSAINGTHSLMLREKGNSYVKENKTFDSSVNLVTTLYLEALGVELSGYTSVDAILDSIVDTNNLTCYTNTDFAKILVPTLYGGTLIKDGNLKIPDSDRTRIISTSELSVGDIILADWSGGDVLYVYVGNSTLLTVKNGVCTALKIGTNIFGDTADNILISLFGYERFAVIRPSMSGIAPTLNVTDVTATTPTRTTYFNGETFAPAGMTVTATYSDSSTAEVSEYTVTPETLMYPTEKVTVSYGTVSTEVSVTVLEKTITASVAEASEMEDGSYVTVEGYFVGTSEDGPGTSEGILIKDTETDALLLVLGVPYGAYPDYGYSYGDKISVIVTVNTSTSTNTPNRKYLQFASSNGTIDSTILSSGNKVTFNFDKVTEVSTWEEMKSLFAVGNIEHYSYIKFTGKSYFNFYSSSNRYRFHKNASATQTSHIKPDGTRSISLANEPFTANLGSNWMSDLFGLSNNTGYPGASVDKEFYAVYVGGNSYYYQIAILNNNWVLSDDYLAGEEYKADLEALKDGSVEINAAVDSAVATIDGYIKDLEVSAEEKSKIETLVSETKIKCGMLNIRFQLSSGTDTSSESTDLRVISTVDSLNYRETGFYVTINGVTKRMGTKYVYTALKSADGESIVSYTPDSIYKNSLYFTTYSVYNIPQSAFDTEITVQAFVVDTNGNEIKGIAKTRTVNGFLGN